MFLDTEKRPQGEPQKLGTLKLSEAIRIGAKLRPQGFDAPCVRIGDGTSCALQAAAEAISGRLQSSTDSCIQTLCISEELASEVYTRNDKDRMTREQIADWLESQGL